MINSNIFVNYEIKDRTRHLKYCCLPVVIKNEKCNSTRVTLFDFVFLVGYYLLTADVPSSISIKSTIRMRSDGNPYLT